MHTTRVEAAALASAVAQRCAGGAETEVLLCPPFPYLEAVAQAVRGTPVKLGAQNLHHEKSGAFTGEVSAAMLVDMGCQYVIVGHSERRQFFCDTDESIHRKLKAALAAGLCPVFCVGERLEDREAGRTEQVLQTQVHGGLDGFAAEQVEAMVIAYEPVWAIGTGRNATPQQADETQAHLRKLLASRYNLALAQRVRILYGGSVKPDNAASLLGQPNVDGALVGGASLSADGFAAIVAAAPRG
jgi:triosephosphate isomerase